MTTLPRFFRCLSQFNAVSMSSTLISYILKRKALLTFVSCQNIFKRDLETCNVFIKKLLVPLGPGYYHGDRISVAIVRLILRLPIFCEK
jgi:hypothetical protein